MEVENETRSGRSMLKRMETSDKNESHVRIKGKKIVVQARWLTNPYYRPRKFYAVFGGIGTESFTMNCFHIANHSTRTYIVNKWPDWISWSTRSFQNWPIGTVVCSFKTTPGHTQFEWCTKSYEKLYGQLYRTHRIVQTCYQAIVTFSSICQIFLLIKNWSYERLVKMSLWSFLPIVTKTSSIAELWNYLSFDIFIFEIKKKKNVKNFLLY